MATNEKRLDLPTLESWLWDAACVIRGPLDAPKFKDYILPLIFLKRLSDVFEDEVQRLGQEFGDPKLAARLVDQDHKLVRLYVPEIARWPAIRQRTTGLGEYLTNAARAVARENPKLQGVIDVAGFNATTAGQRIVDDGRLASLIEVLSRYRLGVNDVEPDILGRAYEYLLRKFAEGQGQSAGEFYTPREVSILIAHLVEPSPGMEVYDPACGSGGLLIKCHLRLLETHGQSKNGARRLPPDVAPLKVYGQEINPATFAMARMNAFIHDMEAEIALGDTMTRPAFKDPSGRLRQFDIVVANPMWNQDFPTSTYEHDPFERFRFGIPPASSADWGWIQHMYASLKDGGRMAVVLDTGTVSRGSGNQGSNRERDIRKKFVDADLVEAVVLLPENLFYNTTAPGIILVINRAKRHPGQVLLVNASKLFFKGRPKNYLAEEHIQYVAAVYHAWKAEDHVSAIVTREEVARNDYNLSPSRYVATDGAEEVLPLEEAMVLLREAEEERAEADEELRRVLERLGLRVG
jgi:type I restriction enzyme M protein